MVPFQSFANNNSQQQQSMMNGPNQTGASGHLALQPLVRSQPIDSVQVPQFGPHGHSHQHHHHHHNQIHGHSQQQQQQQQQQILHSQQQQTTNVPMPTIIQIRFFGHESRQMIPPEFCLIGCTFYIAPSYTENSITAKLVPGWRRKIEKYGGKVLEQYVSGPNNNVTHIVTEHMEGSLQKIALQDNKRCVSIFWLEDVLCNKRLLPPWRFYHLPVAYHEDKPCNNHVSHCNEDIVFKTIYLQFFFLSFFLKIITISNFEGDERERLISLVKRTGAMYTSYLSSKNTVLICKR